LKLLLSIGHSGEVPRDYEVALALLRLSCAVSMCPPERKIGDWTPGNF
jgi:hypothetical protein